MVKPEDLKADYDSEMQMAAQALEQQFDLDLRNRYEGPGKSVMIQRPKGAKQRVLEFVMDKYRTAGWKVSYHSDQRDGDYLEFSH